MTWLIGPTMCVGADNIGVPERPDLEACCAADHLDVSPPGAGMLRTLIDRALSGHGGRRDVRTVVSSFICVPAMLAGSPLVALLPRSVQGHGGPKFPVQRARLDRHAG